MRSNGDRFEAAYNRIDALLRKKVNGARDLSFSAIVQDAARKDATVRANRENLLEYAELRNAIVHDRGKTPVLLADPRDDSLGLVRPRTCVRPHSRSARRPV